MYLKLRDLKYDFKKKKYENKELNKIFLDEATYIKEYIEKKGLDLYEHLKKWDFQENGTIKFRNLKDSISVKFFDFDPDVRDKLLEFSLKYTIDEFSNENNEKNNDKFINYEKMCSDIF